MIEKKGLEFLDNNSSIKALEYFYNDVLEEKFLFFPGNILHGVILAKLVNRPNFNELIEFYSKYAEKFQPTSYYNIFKELIDYLTSSDLFEYNLNIDS